VAKQPIKTQSRRYIIQDALRYAALTVLGVATGSSIVKKRRLLKEGKCVNRGICAGCDVYKNCRLPQALSRKQTLAE
jgi:hypothetical protein